MSHDPLERDAALGRALRDAAAEPSEHLVDWPALRRTIGRRAAPELARRRWRHRLAFVAIPATLAASVLLLLRVLGGPDEANGNGGGGAASVSVAPIPVEQLLDADVSDRQFRALLLGAAEADDLLLIAADEDLQ